MITWLYEADPRLKSVRRVALERTYIELVTWARYFARGGDNSTIARSLAEQARQLREVFGVRMPRR